MSDNLKFIVAITAHRYVGYIFTPYLVETHPACYIVNTLVRYKDLSKINHDFSDREKEIVRLTSKYADVALASKFSRHAGTQDFFSSVEKDFFVQTVIPYVQKQMYKVALLMMQGGIPLHEKDVKYSNIYEEDRITTSESFARALFAFNKHETGTDYELKISQDGEPVKLINRNVKVITQDPCSIVVRNRLLVFSDIDAKKIQPFFTKEVIRIQKEMEEKYFRHFISQVVRDHEVEASGFRLISGKDHPVPVICLEPDLSFRPVIVLRMKYGDNEFNLQDGRKTVVRSEFSLSEYSFYKTERDPEEENGRKKRLIALGLKESGSAFTLPNLDKLNSDQAMHAMVAWLTGNMEKLKSEGFELRQQSLGKNYFTGKQELQFELRKTNDWFDVYAMARFGDFQIPFIRLRKYILNNIREFDLPNGETAILPEEWFSRYKSWVPFAKGEGAVLTFHKHHFNFLRQGMGQVNREVTEELASKLEASLNTSLPEGLKATLRKYQVKGFQWLYALHANGLGGCLADDMGLGKTLQAIALLLKLRKLRKSSASVRQSVPSGQLNLFDTHEEAAGSTASLIVMPTSLVHNWSNELARFAPSLHVYRHVGSQRNLSQGFEKIVQRYDVILTSYGILRNDAETLKNIEFHCLVLDESQYIKNPASKTYKAVMEMKARHKVVLTGTPIENSLSDLWAQMNFLNRGLLGSFQFFKQNFITPIEQHAEEEVESKLQSLIRPFILRRTKSEVADDLPPVMEQTIYCPMSEGQQKAYETEKSIIRNAILSNLENQGVEKSSLVILQGLTRLRQLANHPRLLSKEEEIDSGKFTEIFSYLGSIMAEKHKVLIFSSFVTHLELIRIKLEADNLKYSLLTGRTPNREQVIKTFQEDRDNHVFLISIKAGGVGLNLTEADYVFIIDPWWNPAVESQAISRAHRIGQKKHVFVYRFITEDSIEQKIEMLKEKKSSLAEKFINSNNPFKLVSRDEILSLLN